ncbi:MAG: LLM class flavin-dependent oxidoreductase [Thermoprotei archaeon]
MVRESFRLGLALRGYGDPLHTLSVCRRAEQLGYSRLWFVEVNDVDVFAMSMAAAKETRSIGVASGVVNTYTRLPTTVAMGAATVSALTGGRFTLGIGVGSPPIAYTRKRGETSLRRFRETLEIVTQLLKEGRTTHHGVVFEVNDFQLGVNHQPIPVYAAGMGLGTLGVAAELADGALLMLPTLNHVREALIIIRGKLGKRGSPSFTVASHMITVCSDDPEEALREAKRAVATYAAIPAYRHNFERLGYQKETQEIAQYARLGLETAVECVPDRMVDDFIVYGDPEKCLRTIETYVEAGVAEPVVYPYASKRENYLDALTRTVEALGGLLGGSTQT